MAKTFNQIPVNREEVRMLAIQIGVREAARRLGLNEDRVCKWSERGKWFNKPTHINSSQALVSTVSKPGDVLANELASLKSKSMLNLARYAAEASEQAVNHKNKLKISRKAVDVATVHRSVWPQEQNQNNILQIGFLISDEDASVASEKPAVGHVVEPSESE